MDFMTEAEHEADHREVMQLVDLWMLEQGEMRVMKRLATHYDQPYSPAQQRDPFAGFEVVYEAEREDKASC
jgi:hypothetical protein